MKTEFLKQFDKDAQNISVQSVRDEVIKIFTKYSHNKTFILKNYPFGQFSSEEVLIIK